MLKHLTIPQNVTVKSPDGRVVVEQNFLEFLRLSVCPNIGNKTEHIYTGLRLLALFEGKVSGEVVKLDKADWKILHDAMHKAEWNAFAAYQIISFLHAIDFAEDKEEKKAEANGAKLLPEATA
jgi:hypothetical protein